MADKIKLRRDTQDNWGAVNPILDEGELGVIIDRNTAKIGDGIQGFNNLQSIHGTPEGWVNVKDFGAKGDGVADDTIAIQNAVNYLNSINNTSILYIPKGIYLVTSPITGQVPDILGDSMTTSILKGNGNDYFIFDFTNDSPSKLYATISNLGFKTDTPYSNTSGLKITNSYNVLIEKIRTSNLNYGIYLTNSWCTRISSVRAIYTQKPLYAQVPNGILIDHFYAQRFYGAGIWIVDGLSGTLNSIILEDGVSSNGIVLAGTSGITINGLYTEGEMSTDVLLAQKNQRYCKNITLNGLWLNTHSTIPLDLYYSIGTKINGLELQTPNPEASYIIRTPANDKVYVSNALQYDQNANDFKDDVRGESQPIIPLGDDNRKIILTNPSYRFGDGTDSDLTNIQSNTKKDTIGFYPVSYKKFPIYFDPNQTFGTITGYFVHKTIATCSVYSDNYVSMELPMTIKATSTTSSGLGVIEILVNGETQPNTMDFNYSTSGITKNGRLYVNLEPGFNQILIRGYNTADNSETITMDVNVYS